MKNIKTKISIATIGATLIVLGCAASEYSSPGDVTKTGSVGNGTSYSLDFSVATDRNRIIASNTKVTTLGTCASSATASTTNALSADSAGTGLVVNTGTNTCGVIQKQLLSTNKAYGSTAQNTSTTATITWTWGATSASTQGVQYMRAFSADIDSDGFSTDAVAEGVKFVSNAGVGGIVFIRSVSGLNAANTSGGTCVTASTIAALGTAGQHTAVITITPSGGTSGESTISVTVDGGTAVTSTSTTLGAGDTAMGTLAGLGDAGACAGAGADGPKSGFTRVQGSAAAANLATIFGVLNATTVPVNDHQVTITNGTNATVPYPSDAKVVLNKVSVTTQ